MNILTRFTPLGSELARFDPLWDVDDMFNPDCPLGHKTPVLNGFLMESIRDFPYFSMRCCSNEQSGFNRFMMRPFSFAREGMEIEPQIRMDVKESDGKYLVNAEIPGVHKDDIHVTIDGNRVSISAEVKQEKEAKEGERVIRCERSYGMASRSFTLADEVDQSKVEAKYNNGMLELTLESVNK